MASSFGENVKVTVFGQSHGVGIGVVIEGLPTGEAVDMERLQCFLDRRAPGKNALSTPRKESDMPEFISGIVNGKTCGSPLCAIIRNGDARSKDYDLFRRTPRPGHADLTARLRYGDDCDLRGGGHFSGRLTAPLCIAGGIMLQLLERRGVKVGAHIASVGDVKDDPFDPVNISDDELLLPGKKAFPVVNDEAGERMQAVIKAAAAECNSVGGSVESIIKGLPGGLGDPMFDGVENRLARALFGIPAVKGVEFGAGFDFCQMRGSQANDPYGVGNDGRIVTLTNRCGGILGGITTGMPVVMRVGFKPTPSVAKEQCSVDLIEKKAAQLVVPGRHDPCIVHRAVPVVEAVAACVAFDMFLNGKEN